jgi:cysteine synthase
MPFLGLEIDRASEGIYEKAVEHLTKRRVPLPTFAQLADPSLIPDGLAGQLSHVDFDALSPLNLFRMHWFNSSRHSWRTQVPEHLILGRELTGVEAPIVVMLANRFPMIGTHKVLAAYACLAPRLVTGQFDPTTHRAIWPSTGNYCRGGIAICEVLGCRGVAVLPEGMSRERFVWLQEHVTDPEDIVTTPGTESDVKAIYDRCRQLAQDPRNIVLNQFSEFGNHLVHYLCTGKALERTILALQKERPGLMPRAFVAAVGSGGTLGAGDYLKERFRTVTAAVESLECPTMLRNGFGEHNIQGIGDKHIPLIHNVMNTDFVIAVSDSITDRLNVLCNTDVGRSYLTTRRRAPDAIVKELPSLGLSSLCNLVAAIKLARHLRLGPEEIVLTVATDGANLYSSECEKAMARDFPQGFDQVTAGEAFGQAILGAGADNLLELTTNDRERIFNLGYYTWVEQHGVSIEDFTARRDLSFWTSIRGRLNEWDELIRAFNARTGALENIGRLAPVPPD